MPVFHGLARCAIRLYRLPLRQRHARPSPAGGDEHEHLRQTGVLVRQGDDPRLFTLFQRRDGSGRETMRRERKRQPPKRYLLQSATLATVRPMNRTITQRELRNESAAVLREVQAGRTLIVTRNGVPVAELRPIQPRRFVPRATIAEAAARAPRIDVRRFRADVDGVIDPSDRWLSRSGVCSIPRW